MLTANIIIFLAVCLLMFFLGSWLIKALMRLAKFLRWREFVLAFFIMAFACSLSNLFVGINSALKGIPQLSLGDIIGGNVINLTLVASLAILAGSASLPAGSRMVQTSAVFGTIAAVLPLLLLLDGGLSRIDGVILLLSFIFYVFWLFSKEERFKKVYDVNEKEVSYGILKFLKDSLFIVVAIALLLVASNLMVKSAVAFSESLNVSLTLVGILIVGLGNTLPEIYFSIASARQKETWLILGNLVGSVIYTSTFVLGIIVLISPIKISDFSPFIIARAFLIVSALIFFLAVKSGQKITRLEGLILLSLYILFLFAEILFR